MQRFVPTPAEYLDAVPAAQRPLLDHLRQLICKVVPQAQEVMTYGMLGYTRGEEELFCLAAQKHYVGLYVMPTEALTMLAEELADVDHGKCCLRFKRIEQVPTTTIRKLLKLALDLRKAQPALPEKPANRQAKKVAKAKSLPAKSPTKKRAAKKK